MCQVGGVGGNQTGPSCPKTRQGLLRAQALEPDCLAPISCLSFLTCEMRPVIVPTSQAVRTIKYGPDWHSGPCKGLPMWTPASPAPRLAEWGSKSRGSQKVCEVLILRLQEGQNVGSARNQAMPGSMEAGLLLGRAGVCRCRPGTWVNALGLQWWFVAWSSE